MASAGPARDDADEGAAGVPPVVLVDGSAYLYRAFHAMRPQQSGQQLATADGRPTGAVHVMLNMLRKLVVRYRPARMAVVFDASGRTFRDDMYAEYKAHRAAMPDDMRAQVEPLHALIRALGMPLLVVDGVEADDVIGTLAVAATAAGLDTVVSTGDKDMAQLVDGRVTLVNTMTDTVMDVAGVREKFGVSPDQIPDYLGLVGDASDNIPGVPSCGPKTAAKWLAERGTLEAVIEHADAVKGKIGEKLRDSVAHLPLSKDLATIRTDVALPVDVDGLVLGEPDLDALAALAESLELRTLHREIMAGQSPLTGESPHGGEARRPSDARAAPGAEPAAPVEDGLDPSRYETITDMATLERWAARLEAAELFAFDTETTSLDYMRAEIVGVSFALEPGLAAYVPFTHLAAEAPGAAGGEGADSVAADAAGGSDDLFGGADGAADGEGDGAEEDDPSAKPAKRKRAARKKPEPEPEPTWVPVPGQLDRTEVLERLRPLLEGERRTIVGQHLKYDMNVLANHGIVLNNVAHDTMLQSYVLDSTATRHDMDSLARKFLGVSTVKFEDIAGRGKKQLTFDKVALDVAARYAAEDADVTLRLHLALHPKLRAVPELHSLYTDVEMPLVPVLGRIERTGVAIDTDMLARQGAAMHETIERIANDAYAEAGREFNIGSPKQIQELLYDEKKLPVLKKTPKGQPSTDEDVLGRLAEDHPLPRLILDHRSLTKLVGTYVDKLPGRVNPITGRVHTSYHQAITSTGRLSSADPNLQNIPVRTEAGRRIREAFVAARGYRVLAADYSQIELRIMAHLSGDEGLLDAFARELDVHRATAAEVFGVPLDAVEDDQRRAAKTINFGLIYGMSGFGLARQLGISRPEAQEYIEVYFARYPGVKRYMDGARESARTRGYVETVYGRRLYLPDVNARNPQLRTNAERLAINAPMQGTAADVIKRAMIEVQGWIDAEGVDARMIMQVHDELVLEVRAGEAEDIAAGVAGRMSAAAELAVPLEVDTGIGDSWEEAH